MSRGILLLLAGLFLWPGPAGAQEPFERVREKLNKGDYAGVAELAEKFLAENPNDVDVMVVYGLGMLWSKKYDKSEALFSRVLELAPDYGDAAIGIIKNYIWIERYDKLRRFLADHGARFKKTAYTRVEVLAAELRLELMDHPDEYTAAAVDLAKALLKDDPKNRQALAVIRAQASPAVSKTLREAEKAVAEKRLPDAERLYARALELDPANDDIRFNLARALGWNGKYDESLKVIGAILEKNPRNTDALNVRARVLSWTGRLREAEDAYRRILEIQPADGDAKRGLRDVLRWQGKMDDAFRLSAELLASFPSDEEIVTAHARLLGQRGKSGEAVQLLEQFLEKNPEAPQARGELANQYASARRFADAANELRKSIQLDANNKNNYLSLGKLYSWQDKTDEAVQWYQTLLDREPDNVSALVGLGNTWRFAGMGGRAMEYYQKALSIDPESAEAQEGMRVIREMTAPQARVKYSLTRYDDADPPNLAVRYKTYTEERIVDYQHHFSPDNNVLVKSSQAHLIEKDQRAGDRNYDLVRESISARWAKQWSASLNSVLYGAMHEYKQDLPSFSPLRNKRRRGDIYGILEHKSRGRRTTLLYSEDDYFADQTTGNLKIGDLTTYDVSHQDEIAPGWTLFEEFTAEHFSVSRITRETTQAKLTRKLSSPAGLGIEATYKHVTSPMAAVYAGRLFWSRYDPETKIYTYAHYKHEHENALHDSYHEGDLVYSGPIGNSADYTAELRYTDYFSGDVSWFATGYLTFKY